MIKNFGQLSGFNIFRIKRYAPEDAASRFASWPSTRHVHGCKRWALCVRPAGITSLGVKMYRKETAVYTQRVFMGIGLVRKTRKETERGNRYGRGQRIRARSFNQPTNIEPSDRPVGNGRSTLLLTIRTNREEERKREKKIAEQERRNEGSNRERERADA